MAFEGFCRDDHLSAKLGIDDAKDFNKKCMTGHKDKNMERLMQALRA